ncbi:MAG: hypothetical protein ACR2IE_02635 [Candidatus Sumerlaeaceae bacterium]
MTRTGQTKQIILGSAALSISRFWPAFAALFCVACTLLYLVDIRGFFASDDWVLLGYYSEINPLKFWEYFSLHAVWFYRPTQSLQFGWFYHLFGLNPVPYNLALLILHLTSCFIAWKLLRAIGAGTGVATVALVLFSSSWVYVDVLIWKANFNTLHWAIGTLLTCLCVARSCTSGAWRWKALAIGAAVATCFTKEMVLNLPLLVAITYLCCTPRAKLRAVARQWWPFAAIACVYLACHLLFFKDVNTTSPPGYRFVQPWTGVKQVLFACNHQMFWFYTDPLFLQSMPGIHAVVKGIISYALFLPVLILAAGLLFRDRLIVFGLAWTIAAGLPSTFLVTYHASRFYYVPLLGASLVMAQLLVRALFAVRSSDALLRTVVRVSAFAILAYYVAVGVGMTQLLLDSDKRQSNRLRAFFELLRAERHQVPKGALIVMQNPPTDFVNANLGSTELVKFALQDKTAEGVADKTVIARNEEERLGRLPVRYVVDFNEADLKLRRIR